MRINVEYLRTKTRFPEALGLCYDNTPLVCRAINEITQRLLSDPKQPETGWYGTWTPVQFAISRANPYVTAPAWVARIMFMGVCKRPIQMRNQFWEFLLDGEGMLPRNVCDSSNTTSYTCISPLMTQSVARGWFPTQADVPTTAGKSYFIRAYPADPADLGKQILVQAYDNNGLKIYGKKLNQQIEGFPLILTTPFIDSVDTVGPKGIYGIQKDYTYGDVTLQAVDADTLEVTALARYEPGDTLPLFPRYYLDSLPTYCCQGQGTINIDAMAKLDFRPVAVDSDWLIINNVPALISEGQAIYQDGIPEAPAAVLQRSKHSDAINFLQGELDHYMGKSSPAISVSLFGTAHTRERSIGVLR